MFSFILQARQQVFPPKPEDEAPLTRLQERLLKKLGKNAYPFKFQVCLRLFSNFCRWGLLSRTISYALLMNQKISPFWVAGSLNINAIFLNDLLRFVADMVNLNLIIYQVAKFLLVYVMMFALKRWCFLVIRKTILDQWLNVSCKQSNLRDCDRMIPNLRRQYYWENHDRNYSFVYYQLFYVVP